jgi:hypothetical protein
VPRPWRAPKRRPPGFSRAGARADQRDRTGHPQIEPVLQPRPTHEPAGDGGGHNFGAKKPPGPLTAASTGAPVTPTSAGARCRRVEKGGTRTARSATAERVLVHAVNHPRPAGPNPIAGGEQELSGAPTRCSGHTDPRAAVASSEQRGRLVGRKTVLPGRAGPGAQLLDGSDKGRRVLAAQRPYQHMVTRPQPESLFPHHLTHLPTVGPRGLRPTWFVWVRRSPGGGRRRPWRHRQITAPTSGLFRWCWVRQPVRRLSHPDLVRQQRVGGPGWARWRSRCHPTTPARRHIKYEGLVKKCRHVRPFGTMAP